MWSILFILGFLILVIANGEPRGGHRGCAPDAGGPKTPPKGGSAVRRRPF